MRNGAQAAGPGQDEGRPAGTDYRMTLISSAVTTAPMSIGSQKSEKIEQLKATIEIQAKPLR